METERLILQPFSEEDLDLVLRLYGNREIMRYMPYDVMDKTEAEEHLQRLIAGWQEDPVLNREYAVIRKDSGEKIGRCHIQIDPETDTGMLGWLLVEKELAPRTVMLTPPPGEPSAWLTCTPAILPCMPWATSTAPPAINSSPLIWVTAPERSRFFIVP